MNLEDSFITLTVERTGFMVRKVRLRLAVIGIVVFLLVALVTLFSWYQSYKLTNYQYVLSSLLQSMATVLTLVVSSTVILIQLLGDASPLSLDAFPKKRLLLLGVIFLVTVLLDTAGVILLPEKSSFILRELLNFLIVANLVCFSGVIWYVGVILEWLRPEKTVQALLERNGPILDNEKTYHTLLSLEERTTNAIRKGYVSSAVEMINTFGAILHSFVGDPELREPSDEDTVFRIFWTKRPSVIFPECLGRLAGHLCRCELSSEINKIGTFLGSYAMWIYEFDSNAAVRVEEACEMVLVECLRAEQPLTAESFVRCFYEQIHWDPSLAEALRPAMTRMLFIAQRWRSPELVNIVLLGLLRLLLSPKSKMNLRAVWEAVNEAKQPWLMKTGVASDLLDNLDSVLKDFMTEQPKKRASGGRRLNSNPRR